MPLTPVLFVGHGSPMNIVRDNSYTRDLKKLSAELPRPDAIVVVSAHWLTDGTFVSSSDNPKQIYDFFGFPDELYAVKYPAPGLPELAGRITSLTGGVVKPSDKWGLDHASWAVLVHLYPRADIPVLEISLDMTRLPEFQFELGQMLKPLREENILVIGSGNMIHNLFEVDFTNEDAPPYHWARTADDRLAGLLEAGDSESLIHYRKTIAEADLIAPTPDHFLPLVTVLGMKNPGERTVFTHSGIQNASVSMRCCRIG